MLLTPRPSPRGTGLALAVTLALLLIIAPEPSSVRAMAPREVGARTTERGWEWPLSAFTVEEKFAAPAHAYGPGHRGIDLRPTDSAVVRAPASGVVAFVGVVAGRGVLTIEHQGGYVTTLEPVVGLITPGAAVGAGQDVATVSEGGHTARGALHFGVRHDGEYINPLLLLGGVPRAVLLPCCDPFSDEGHARG